MHVAQPFRAARPIRVWVLACVIGLVTPGARAAAQQPQALQLVVTGAAPDPGGQTLTITGENFVRRPLVTLDLVPVNVRYASDVQIVAAVPVSLMPPGTYLLSVSRGPSAAENGAFQLTLGTGRPKAEAAASDPVPATLGASGAEPAAKVGDRVITVAEVDQE